MKSLTRNPLKQLRRKLRTVGTFWQWHLIKLKCQRNFQISLHSHSREGGNPVENEFTISLDPRLRGGDES
jgi:hypothetical protein